MFVGAGFFCGSTLRLRLCDGPRHIREIGADRKSFSEKVSRTDTHLGESSFTLKERRDGTPIGACHLFIQRDGISYTADGSHENSSIPAWNNPAADT